MSLAGSGELGSFVPAVCTVLSASGEGLKDAGAALRLPATAAKRGAGPGRDRGRGSEGTESRCGAEPGLGAAGL